MTASLSLGIDIGGTFTDLVAFDPDSGRTFIWKESTTPDDPARGAVEGTRHLLRQHAIDPSRIGRVVHATTLFTNALIERKGARTGLLTTAGFRDTLEIGRERKYELYDLFIEMPPPLVPRHWRREVAERLAPDGSVEIALDEAAVLREAEALVAEGIESLAIVFLHAYANAVHEQRAADLLARRFPHLSVSLSSDIAPEIREYPRASTTVANAYVRPLAERYLDRLETSLRDIGVTGGFFLMLSNGGLTHVAEARRAPVQLLESGPAAGALAGAWFGRNAGLHRVLAFDMGGTTAKLALVGGGEPLVAWGFEAARARRFLRGSGLPIQIATIELIEIGAGGGSIARRSELGTLNVGPDSAGADPGPACYARGGNAPTVTDADLLLGYLDAEFFLGGAMRIDKARASDAMRGLGDALGMDMQRAAFGVHDVVNENMVGAARVAIAERGRVPHEYALMATGGAAPVHAWQVARKLGIKRLVCPPGAGVGSTIGMLMAPARVDRVASLNVPLAAADWAEVARSFARLHEEAEAVIAATGATVSQASARRLADMRYIGQGSEITVALPDALNAEAVRAAFEVAYRALFSRTPPGAAIQFVALRLALSAPMPGSGGRLALTPREAAARKGVRQVWFPEAGGFVETAVYERYALRAGEAIEGPAVFEENESTLVIGPGGRATVLDDGHDRRNTNPRKERLVGTDSQGLASVLRFLHGESDSRSRVMTAPVKVTRDEHTPQDLRRMAASLKDAGHARRLQAISFVLDGWPRSRAAEFADVDRQTLRDWVERYNEGGIGALATFTSPGRRRMLTPNQDEELYEIVEKGPDLDKDGVVRWRRVDLVQQSAARFGVPEVHPSTMGRWLHRIGLTKLTTRPHHPKKDEAAQQAFKENFKDIANEKLPAAVKENGTPVEFWFQDEARIGQQGTLSRVWAPVGSRPAMVRDNRRANAYLYGAICPSRSIGAALVMASANTEAMNEHLKEISVQVETGAHAALICDGAGWHAKSKDLIVPSNITLITLPPYAPELNPMENVWEFLRDNRFGAQVWKTYGAIVRACAKAWNWFVSDPHRIATIGTREWVIL